MRLHSESFYSLTRCKGKGAERGIGKKSKGTCHQKMMGEGAGCIRVHWENHLCQRHRQAASVFSLAVQLCAHLLHALEMKTELSLGKLGLITSNKALVVLNVLFCLCMVL